jgi:GNAT superfamily N-acetyltransferase
VPHAPTSPNRAGLADLVLLDRDSSHRLGLSESRRAMLDAGSWRGMLNCPFLRLHPVMDNFHITTDKTDLDITLIHHFLSEESTWARNIPRSLVEKAIAHSLCFGGYLDGAQIAFARVVTDCATFANLVDVFVLTAYRGKGYSKALVAAVLAHPDLQGLRRFTLATFDAHGLYAQFGFTAPRAPHSLMERYFPGIYDAVP